MIRNAAEEIIETILKCGVDVDCIEIFCPVLQDDELMLYQGYSQDELDSFMLKMNFEYDSGYGCQFLHGTIWLKNGSWIRREEYDGSEWWEVVSCPKKPERVCR